MTTKTYEDAILFIAQKIVHATLSAPCLEEMYLDRVEGMVQMVAFTYDISHSKVRNEAKALAVKLIECK